MKTVKDLFPEADPDVLVFGLLELSALAGHDFDENSPAALFYLCLGALSEETLQRYEGPYQDKVLDLWFEALSGRHTKEIEAYLSLVASQTPKGETQDYLAKHYKRIHVTTSFYDFLNKEGVAVRPDMPVKEFKELLGNMSYNRLNTLRFFAEENPETERYVRILENECHEALNGLKDSDTFSDGPRFNADDPAVYSPSEYAGPLRIPPDLLETYNDKPQGRDDAARVVEAELKGFGIGAKVVNVSQGPTVTLYEVDIPEGVRTNKVKNLSENIAMRLGVQSVTVEVPLPGKTTIGIEVPNKERAVVGIRELIEDKRFIDSPPLTIALGRGLDGEPVYLDLAKAPHLLVAGATGSGKSVCLTSIIMSLLYHTSEAELVLIDPKRVELSLFSGIPQLHTPVIKDIGDAADGLAEMVEEMDRRYKTLEKEGFRNIAEYSEAGGGMSYIVVIIDEMADLMMRCKDSVETAIARLTQLARAVGIHIVVATQRPSTQIIPSRIAFATASGVDSRVILDTQGAQNLLGYGDMLYMAGSKPIRAQGCFISDKEIKAVVEYAKKHCLGVEDPLMKPALEDLREVTLLTAPMLMEKYHIDSDRAVRIIAQLNLRDRILDTL